MTRKEKVRLDHFIQDLRPDLSRSRIQALIMAGRVTANRLPADKPGMLIDEDALIRIAEADNPYVSRGGLKLAGALEDFALDVSGLKALDVGASTGGFTDCLLQNGAVKIYALDVGYGQLDFRLRSDQRVVAMERFNIRRLTAADLPEKIDLAVIDVSFISLKYVLPIMAVINIPELVALIKPQFEAGKTDAGRGKGVIRNPSLQVKIIESIIAYAAAEGYCCRGLTYSRLPGPKGNIEYFIWLALNHNSPGKQGMDHEEVTGIVKQAHRVLTVKK